MFIIKATTRSSSLWWIRIVATLFWSVVSFGQSKNEVQMQDLMRALCEHSLQPASAIDPQLDQKERERNLSYFAVAEYELLIRPQGTFAINGVDHASVPVRVHFKTPNKEVDTDTSIQFIKRGDNWYFADFSFLAFPTVIIVVIVIAGLIGIFYAGGVLFVRSRLIQHGDLSGRNWVELFIPIFWRKILRKG